MAAVVAAVAAYFASQHPPSGKLPSGRNRRDRETPQASKLVDIRPFIGDIPEGILQLCPRDLREHHLEHLWIPFCSKKFLDSLLLYKDGKITEEVLTHLFTKSP